MKRRNRNEGRIRGEEFMQEALIRASAGQWGVPRELAEEPVGVREDGSGDVQNGMPALRLVVWR